MDLNLLKRKNVLQLSILLIVFLYVVFNAYKKGIDCNVYLYASQMFFKGGNIYENNPFNNYLYSPFFAMLLRPLSIFKLEIGRILWAVINLGLVLRLWQIIENLATESLFFYPKQKTWWRIAVLFISAGFLVHNFNLGQVTIVLLWLTFEGIYQVVGRNKKMAGAMLLAMGTVIKIVPLIGLFYLFFKGRYKAVAMAVGFILILLLLPSFFVGFDYNLEMLQNWFATINPTNSKYVFENNQGTISLNSIIPAYFFEFGNTTIVPSGLKRLIFPVSYPVLSVILQVVRVLLLFSVLIPVFYKNKQRNSSALYLLWEISYLLLISALVFPHQQKYVLLYLVPAGAYMLLFVLFVARIKPKLLLKHKIIAVLSSVLLFIAAIMGRDIVGSYVLDIYDYYRGAGLIVLTFSVFLLLIKPDLLNEMSNKAVHFEENEG
jgi:hypothetical protein